MPSKHKNPNEPVPCYFLQTGVGNIVMRLRTLNTSAGAPLTLHQIVTMNVPVKDIPFFDLGKFKEFYGNSNYGRAALYRRVTRHQMEEEKFLEHLR